MLNIEQAQARWRDRGAVQRAAKNYRIQFPLVPVILLALILIGIVILAIYSQDQRITIRAQNYEIRAMDQNAELK